MLSFGERIFQRFRYEAPKTLNHDPIRISLKKERVVKFLCLVVLFLSVGHLVSIYFEFYSTRKGKLEQLFIRYFNFGIEGNFPTYFSSLLFLFSSATSYLISRIEKKVLHHQYRYWVVLSLTLLFLALDEATMIHEHTMGILHKAFPNLPKVLASAWVIPYALFSLFLALYFLRFLIRLPKRTRALFFISGFIFTSGALGLEVAETYVVNLFGSKHLSIIIVSMFQELLEMLGLITFIYALLDYLSVGNSSFRLKVRVH